MLRREIQAYMKRSEMSPQMLGDHLGIHSNSVRHFFKMKGQNSFKIIEWYLKQEGVKDYKKNLLCQAIDNGTSKEELKKYIMSL